MKFIFLTNKIDLIWLLKIKIKIRSIITYKILRSIKVIKEISQNYKNLTKWKIKHKLYLSAIYKIIYRKKNKKYKNKLNFHNCNKNKI